MGTPGASVFDWLRLAAVFSRSRDLHPDADPRCSVEKNVRAANGWRVDRYRPKKPSGAFLVLLHGWTLRGKDDLRLQAFARSLAIAGVECCVPNLPGLAMLTFDTGDVLGLRALLGECPSRPGIIGFSLGGSYALLAASDHANQPRFVVSVGGYGDLPATFRRSTQWGRQRPADPVACPTGWTGGRSRASCRSHPPTRRNAVGSRSHWPQEARSFRPG